MKFNKYNNYDKYPTKNIQGYDNEAWQGYAEIINEIKSKIAGKEKAVVVVDTYIGVDLNEIRDSFSMLEPALVLNSDEYAISGDEITAKMEQFLTDDRVFGVMNNKKLEEFFPESRLEDARNEVSNVNSGVVLIYGVGASLICRGDVLVFADMARWEIQQRYRKGMSNWKIENPNEDVLRKYKRAFFFEWRTMDRHKKKMFSSIDYLLDTNAANNPKMITNNALFGALEKVANEPFRVVPYFDPGVWGGQWMKDVCGLDKEAKNFAWSFDGVPEENSLLLGFNDVKVEIPAINLVFFKARKLLGEKVHGRFGTEFPIRFDFLDTMGGQNLSLQVHPLTEYIQENFGMNYTQDESYYILDCEDDAVVYLGLKENVNKDEMLNDLRRAEKGEISFDADKYINKFEAKKHDHFLIPAGTLHCSGDNTMVLEVSATPYIFTFKLWDWDRVGLDGKPRPIHLKHGEKNIQWDRTTEWVKENLVNAVYTVGESEGIKEEHTGLHEREFIETRRHWFSKPVIHETNGSVNMVNLVEGAEAIVESLNGEFEPFVVHYAETFIIPASVGKYSIRPYGQSEGKEIATLKAYVR